MTSKKKLRVKKEPTEKLDWLKKVKSKKELIDKLERLHKQLDKRILY